MKEFLQINPADTVAVALKDLPGVSAGHKFALRDIAEGEDIIKYGNPIGHATRPIAKGELVNHNNIATNLSGTLDYSGIEAAPPAGVERKEAPLTFWGYPRSDGQVGIRNDIWVIPTVGCVNGICRQIVEQATPLPSRERSGVGLLYFPHNYGCSQLGEDHENTRKVLRDMALHPNAGGVLIVGLGCENNQPREFEKLLGDYDRQRIRFLISQEVEGDEVEAGVAIVKELYAQAQTCERVPVPLSHLRVGLKCGGSDGFSGITANPLLGAFSDWLCAQGGSTILTEVPEMFGAEHLLMRRAVSDEVLQDTIRLINDFKEYYLSHGQPVGENPSPGNKAGGISTLEEKALGCTQKSGMSPVMGVLKYGERLAALEPQVGGLHLLSAPGNDLVASTALAAAGCQLVLFTTGRGTPFSTFVPTLKVSTNSDLARRKPQWIDFDAGVLLEDVPMDELLHRFSGFVMDVASGRIRTTAEQHGNAEFAIFKTGVTL
ncbi:MAG: altronate dehydratase [Bacteroidaceae bacterium]|nr:altronate dehydratase [Bacteroidaceae bacterium]